MIFLKSSNIKPKFKSPTIQSQILTSKQFQSSRKFTPVNITFQSLHRQKNQKLNPYHYQANQKLTSTAQSKPSHPPSKSPQPLHNLDSEYTNPSSDKSHSTLCFEKHSRVWRKVSF